MRKLLRSICKAEMRQAGIRQVNRNFAPYWRRFVSKFRKTGGKPNGY